MLYLDTSILVSYYSPERESERVERIITKIYQPAISYLTAVELSSAVSRKIREKNLSHMDGSKIIRQFESHVAEKFFQMIPLEYKHFQTAQKWISAFNTTLKSLDALHLAISADINLPIFTADSHLAKSAKFLGIGYKFLT